MENLRVTVGRVVDFDDQSKQPDAILKLNDTNAYLVSKKDPRFEVWARMIKERRTQQGLLYVEFQLPMYRVTKILLPSLRRIESVALQPEGTRVKVVIFMAPSLYFINSARTGFRELRRVLEESTRTNTDLFLSIDPDSLEILDARSADVSGAIKVP